MLFNALSFAVFLPLVFGLYWLIGKCGHAGRVTLPRHPFHLRYPFHLQNLFIVVASYVFYGWWDWKFLLLITFTSLWAWGSGLALCACNAQRAGGKVEELKSGKVQDSAPPP